MRQVWMAPFLAWVGCAVEPLSEGIQPEDVYELRTAGGYCLKLTADHRVWTRQRGWKPPWRA